MLRRRQLTVGRVADLRSYTAQYGKQLRSHEDMVKIFATPKQQHAASGAKKRDATGGGAVSPYNYFDPEVNRGTEGVGAPRFTKDELESFKCRTGAAFVQRVLPLLERVEDRLLQWRRQKWEMRIPVLLSPQEKDQATMHLRTIRDQTLARLRERRQTFQELSDLSRLLNEPVASLRTKDRAWIETQVTKLRWNGDVQSAREVRQLWMKIEASGSVDKDLLERLCCVYGMAKFGTFDDAFTNTISARSHLEREKRRYDLIPTEDQPIHQPDRTVARRNPPSLERTGEGGDIVADREQPPLSVQEHQATSSVGEDYHNQSGLVVLDKSNIFNELVGVTLVNLPTLPILHDFLGMHLGTLQHDGNYHAGYRLSLASYIARSLEHQLESAGKLVLPAHGKQSRVSVQGEINGRKVLLFDFKDSSVHDDPTTPPICDLCLFVGADVTLLQIGHPNRHVRQSLQLPHRRQLEGVCRRASFVLGIPFDKIRVRTLMLPPKFVDLSSLNRLHEVLLLADQTTDSPVLNQMGQPVANTEAIPPECRVWVSQYSKELGSGDVDFSAQTKKKPEEEWVML